MKLHKLFILVFLVLSSCDLKEKVEKFKILEAELETQFEYNNINIGFGWGSSDESNYLRVTFSEYSISTKEYVEIKTIAKKVFEFVLTKDPTIKSLDFIEVRFEDEESIIDNESYIIFKRSDF